MFGKKAKPKPPKKDKAGWMNANDYAKYAQSRRDRDVRIKARKKK